jgi:DNA-binding transcriptional LysR family regulator
LGALWPTGQGADRRIRLPCLKVSIIWGQSLCSEGDLSFYGSPPDRIDIAAAFRSRLSVNTIDAAIDAGLCGFGMIRVNSYQVVDHVRDNRLTVVLEAFEPAPRPVHLVHGQQSRLPLKLRSFINLAAPRLRERLTRAAL